MDVGHVVYFRSQQYPFLVETQPCLDLECACQEMGFRLREILPPSGHPRDRLTFAMRICLRTWQERNPPPRSLEVESLAREFLARFPDSRIHELCEEFKQVRASQRHFEAVTLTDSPDKLVSYAQVIGNGRSVREGNTKSCFFFVFEGREFLVEDQYCANPQCDCGCVHLEFWERVPQQGCKSGFQIVQQLEARFRLEGKLVETRYSHEDAETTKYLLAAWVRRCSEQFAEYRRRYDRMKQVGARSFPLLAEPQRWVRAAAARPAAIRIDTEPRSLSVPSVTDSSSEPRVRRNDPCPCGSGRKFKRCCARRLRQTVDGES